jgi:hypothetical protein
MARPTKYKKKYIKEMLDYFKSGYERYLSHDFSDVEATKYVIDKKGGKTKMTKKTKSIVRLPTLFNFAMKIDVNTSTLSEWASKHPEFSNALSTCKEMVADIAIQGSANNLIQANVAKLIIMNSSDWTDKQEIDHGGHITINIEGTDAGL